MNPCFRSVSRTTFPQSEGGRPCTTTPTAPTTNRLSINDADYIDNIIIKRTLQLVACRSSFSTFPIAAANRFVAGTSYLPLVGSPPTNLLIAPS